MHVRWSRMRSQMFGCGCWDIIFVKELVLSKLWTTEITSQLNQINVVVNHVCVAYELRFMKCLSISLLIWLRQKYSKIFPIWHGKILKPVLHTRLIESVGLWQCQYLHEITFWWKSISKVTDSFEWHFSKFATCSRCWHEINYRSIVWDYAKSNDLIIVSKDSDMHDLSLVFGNPPKVIWLRLGNCSTLQVENLLRRNFEPIRLFYQDEYLSLLSLS